jgi:hypothetical protein
LACLQWLWLWLYFCAAAGKFNHHAALRSAKTKKLTDEGELFY